MATSRTGTAWWKKLRARRLWYARHVEGQTRCPHCDVLLNYDVSKLPNSAEVDHIVPYALGGQDVWENTEVICRRCNQSKGDNGKPKLTQAVVVAEIRNTGRW